MIFDRSLGSKWSHGRVAGAFEDIVTWVKSSSSVWSMRPSLRIQEPKKTMEKPWAVESIGFAEVQQWGVWAK